MTRYLLPLAAVLLALAACSSGSTGGSATPDPAIAFCAALDPYSRALVKLDKLTPDATVDEFKSAVAEAKAALAAVVKVAGPFVGAQLNTAQTAQSNLEAAAQQLPPGATPAEAETALDPYLKTLIGEVAGVQLATCNTRPTASAAS
jgi:hypothetical protein